MTGSMLSHPPRLTPRIGIVPYFQDWFKAGVLLLACVVSSQLEFRPMIGSPPTITSVNVTLKSVVSYQLNGSNHVPLADAGILLSETPFRFEFDGWPVLVVPPEVVEAGFESFFDTTMATGIMIANKTRRITTKMTIVCQPWHHL